MLEGVFLIGTIHTDPKGPERLAQALDFYRPDIIAIEPPEEKARVAIRRHAKVRDARDRKFDRFLQLVDLDPASINRETTRKMAEAYGFEAHTSHAYAAQHGISLTYLDEGQLYQDALAEARDFFKRHKGQWDWLKQNVLSAPIMRAQSLVDLGYLMALGSDDKVKSTARNVAWAEKIKMLEGRVAVVVGSAHVFGAEPNLKTLFKDYETGYVSLDQAINLR